MVSEAEFSRPLAVDQIDRPKELHLTADETERAALAKRFDLLSLSRLEAWVTVKPQAKGRIVRLNGRFEGEVEQTCVVTLEPVAATVSDDFSMVFSAEAVDNAPGREVLLEVDEDDLPEPIIDGVIDLGEMVAEHFSLALDPFPRKPGVEFTPESIGNEAQGDDTAGDGKPNPFAVLATLRKSDDN